MKKKIFGELILVAFVVAEYVFLAAKYGLLEMIKAFVVAVVVSSIIGFAVWCVMTGGDEEKSGGDEEE